MIKKTINGYLEITSLLKKISFSGIVVFAVLCFYQPPRSAWSFLFGNFFIIAEFYLWIKLLGFKDRPGGMNKGGYLVSLFVLKFPVLYSIGFYYIVKIKPPSIPIFLGLSFPIFFIMLSGIMRLNKQQGVRI